MASLQAEPESAAQRSAGQPTRMLRPPARRRARAACGSLTRSNFDSLSLTLRHSEALSLSLSPSRTRPGCCSKSVPVKPEGAAVTSPAPPGQAIAGQPLVLPGPGESQPAEIYFLLPCKYLLPSTVIKNTGLDVVEKLLLDVETKHVQTCPQSKFGPLFLCFCIRTEKIIGHSLNWL